MKKARRLATTLRHHDAGTTSMKAPPDRHDTQPAPAAVSPRAQAMPRRAPLRLPSIRASAGLAAAMLGLGVAIGAAIGPAPSPSLAGQDLPWLMRSLVGQDAARAGAPARPATSAPTTTPAPSQSAAPAAASAAGAGVRTGTGTGTGRGTAKSKTRAPSAALFPTSTPSPAKAPAGAGAGKGTQQAPLPPVTNVWLIALAGSTFAQALAQPAAASYIDGQLVKQGTLLSGWSALAGQAFAGEAALSSGTPPQNLDAIVQPPCPEGAAGVSCRPESAGALAAADAFLAATIPAITAGAAYRAHGLIVITFATIANATAASLPAGASTATLGSEPPAGVLLLSPFARAGARPSAAFTPTSPRRSVSALLR
jgi:hypothetical protein